MKMGARGDAQRVGRVLATLPPDRRGVVESTEYHGAALYKETGFFVTSVLPQLKKN